MELLSLSAILLLIQEYGYLAIAIGAMLQGPVVGAAGAFLASIGLLNLFWVIIFAFIGELLADAIYFYMGRKGGALAIEKYDRKWRINKQKLVWLHNKLHQNFYLSIAVMKLTPFLAPAGIMLVGSSKVSFKKFIFGSLLVVVPVATTFMLIGFYFGFAFDIFYKYFKLAKEILLLAMILFAIVIYLIQKGLYKKITRKLYSLFNK